MRDTEREAETQAEGEAGSMQEAQCGTWFQIPETWDLLPHQAPCMEQASPPACVSASLSLSLSLSVSLINK